MAFLSVIIPFYNKFDHIQRCVDSIIKQSFQDVEIIIVDDGSDNPLTTESLHFLEGGKIQIFRINNSGPGFARNFGALKSNGDYLLFLDADDYLNEGSLAFFTKQYSEQKNCDCFLYSFKYISQSFTRMPFLEGEYAASHVCSDMPLDKKNLSTAVNFFAAGSAIIKRALFLKYGGYFDKYNARFGEDAYFWIQVVLSGCKILRSSFCFVLIDDTASQLGIALRSNRPVPVFINEYKTLKKKIAGSKMPLFKSWIKFHIHSTGVRLINEGRVKELFKLFFKHPGIIVEKDLIIFSLKKTVRNFSS
jgi:glycosyltransferase involved in cell wall biosynthesis